MVLIEHLAGVGHIDRVAGMLAPGQLGEPLQVGAYHLILGRTTVDAPEAIQLAVGLLAGHLAQVGSGQLLT